MSADVIVVGGGVVGSAIAYGLVGHKLRVLVLDGSDRDFRASHANFGLVWQQGKGIGMPAYQQLACQSVELWPNFSAELTDVTSIDLQYERNGGLVLCMGEDGLEKKYAELMRLHNQLPNTNRDWEMIDRSALQRLFPKAQLGSDVSGASFGRSDGQTNPLRLLAALHAGILRKGGQIRTASIVRAIRSDPRRGFTLDVGSENLSAGCVVIAAGLGSKDLAAQIGLNVPLHPERGQLLVTERLEPLLPLPMSGLRQTRDGTVMIGVTNEDAGYDTSTTSKAAAALSANAIRRFPVLSQATLVRQWAGLRVLTPDGYPVYAESESHPGAFVALCHSGIGLAAAHASIVAEAIASGQMSPFLNSFHNRRFDVSKAA